MKACGTWSTLKQTAVWRNELAFVKTLSKPADRLQRALLIGRKQNAQWRPFPFLFSSRHDIMAFPGPRPLKRVDSMGTGGPITCLIYGFLFTHTYTHTHTHTYRRGIGPWYTGPLQDESCRSMGLHCDAKRFPTRSVPAHNYTRVHK